MRLLFVHQHLGSFGGAEANILLTATELKRRGYKLALLYANATGKGEAAWREAFDEIYSLNDSEGVATTLQRFEPEIVYLHNLEDLTTIEALLDSRVPVVRMVHDHSMYCLRGYKYNYFTRAICTHRASFRCIFPCLATIARNRGGGFPLKWASYSGKREEIELNRRCNEFVVYSEYSKAELVRNGFPAERIHIHVPIRCWGNDAPTSSFSNRNLILFVGQIIRGKGVDLLLQSLARVKAPFECMIVGDGNHRSYCEKLAEQLGLADKVRFCGFIPSDELKELYLDTSVFVVPSVWPEPFGLVGPEAMRYGLPVVAFNSGGISEWLTDGQNGALVDRMDTTQFADRIDELLADKELARCLGKRGMERVNSCYESSRQVDNLEALLERVARDTAACESPVTVPQPLAYVLPGTTVSYL